MYGLIWLVFMCILLFVSSHKEILSQRLCQKPQLPWRHHWFICLQTRLDQWKLADSEKSVRTTLPESPVLFHDTWIPTWLLIPLKPLTLVSRISLWDCWCFLAWIPIYCPALRTICQSDAWPHVFPTNSAVGQTPSLVKLFSTAYLLLIQRHSFFNRKHFI